MIAIRIYQKEKGTFSSSLQELVNENFLPDLEFVQYQPFKRERLPWNYFKPIANSSTQDQIILSSPETNKLGNRIVCYADYSAKAIPEQEYQLAMQKQ